MIESQPQVRYLPDQPKDMSSDHYGAYIAEHLLLGDEPWTDDCFKVFGRYKKLEDKLELDCFLLPTELDELLKFKKGLQDAFPNTHQDIWAAFELVYELRQRSIQTVTIED